MLNLTGLNNTILPLAHTLPAQPAVYQWRDADTLRPLCTMRSTDSLVDSVRSDMDAGWLVQCIAHGAVPVVTWRTEQGHDAQRSRRDAQPQTHTTPHPR